jgi:hypothetical protein
MASRSSGGLKPVLAFFVVFAAVVSWQTCSESIPSKYLVPVTATITNCYPCMREYCFQYAFVNEHGDSCYGRFAAAYYDVIENRHDDCIGMTISVSYDKRDCSTSLPRKHAKQRPPLPRE